MLINLPVSVMTRDMSYEGDCADRLELAATDRGTLLRYTSNIWFIGSFIRYNYSTISHSTCR